MFYCVITEPNYDLTGSTCGIKLPSCINSVSYCVTKVFHCIIIGSYFNINALALTLPYDDITVSDCDIILILLYQSTLLCHHSVLDILTVSYCASQCLTIIYQYYIASSVTYCDSTVTYCHHNKLLYDHSVLLYHHSVLLCHHSLLIL